MLTSASWSIEKRAGGASNATFTSSSRVAASDWRETRATRPAYSSPLRRTMRAGMPSRTRPASASSMRAATHSVAGSTRRKIVAPGAAMLPTSAARWITRPSIGAVRRVSDQSASA